MTTTIPTAAKPEQGDKLVEPAISKKLLISDKWYRWVTFVDAAVRRTSSAATDFSPMSGDATATSAGVVTTAGASGSFTTVDGKTCTVVHGLIKTIV